MRFTFFINCKKTLQKLPAIALALSCLWLGRANAQSNISYSCGALNLSGTAPLKCNPVAEDDPNDLSECYSEMGAYLTGNNQFNLNFPAKTGTYHWRQSSAQDKNDSLAAEFIYNTNPKVYGYDIRAYAKDFTISISRYDSNKGGIIEGAYSGTMEAYAAWDRQTVQVTVRGSFHTTRTGNFGVECRKLRRNEKLITENAKRVINRCVTEQLQRMGWQAKNSSDIPPSTANHTLPYRPFGFCSGVFDLTINPDPNTAFGKMINDSIRYYSGQTDMHSILRGVILQNLQRMKIRIDLNSPYIKTPYPHNPADKYTVLNVTGAGYAYRLTEPEHGATADVPPDYKTIIRLGNWAGADMHAAQYVNYPFLHKQPGPYIETITVEIDGPAYIVDKIIRNVDWQGLSAALAK